MYSRKMIAAAEERLKVHASTTAIFSYGSNSTSQLRARVENPNLRTVPARLHGYSRIFAGDSMTWGGGGVASLVKSRSNHWCLGSLVYLSSAELDRLELYEGGYDLCRINVEVFNGHSGPVDCDKDIGEMIAASVFIRRNSTFVEPPSEPYLTAIAVHLREHFYCKDVLVDINEWTSSSGDDVICRGRYIAPPPSLLLTLEALMVEVNQHPLQDTKWEMPRKGFKVAATLRELGIDTVAQLHVQVTQGDLTTGPLAEMVKSEAGAFRALKEMFTFTFTSTSSLVDGEADVGGGIHGVNGISSIGKSSNLLKTPRNMTSCELYNLFVYGTLRYNQIHHFRLKEYGIDTDTATKGVRCSYRLRGFEMMKSKDVAYPCIVESDPSIDINISTSPSSSSSSVRGAVAASGIVGEVYPCTYEQLWLLDRFESSSYERKIIAVDRIGGFSSKRPLQAFVYVASRELQREIQLDRRSDDPHYSHISSGDWASYTTDTRSKERLKDGDSLSIRGGVIDVPIFHEIRRFNTNKIILFGEGDGPGGSSLLFSAPHTLKLCRDGEKDHLNEPYTGELAREFARINRGYCVTWNKSEASRVKEYMAANEGRADPSNRDPNYLTASEVPSSPWLEAMSVVSSYVPGSSTKLHVDIHGMKDPDPLEIPTGGSDCCIGTAAMFRYLNLRGSAQEAAFCQKIRDLLTPILAKKGFGNLHFNKLPNGRNLSGDWSQSDGTRDRNTLTQVSSNPLNFKYPSTNFTFAVQVEMSLRLRKALLEDGEFRTELALCFPKLIDS